MILTDTKGVGKARLPLGGVVKVYSPLGLLWHHPAVEKGETGEACYNLVRVEFQALYLAFAGGVGAGPQFFLWPLARAEQLLSKSFRLCQAAPFLILWLERAGFFGGAFVGRGLSPLAFVVDGLFSSKSRIYKAKQTKPNKDKKQKPRELITTSFLGLWGP